MRGPLSTRHYRLALRRYGFDVAVSASQTIWINCMAMLEFYDMNEVARQLGIAPVPGSRAERAAVALQRLQARFASR